MCPIQSSDLGIPADDPVNLTNEQLAADLFAIVDSLSSPARELVNEAAHRLAYAGD